ncbi:hypothetical protein EVAR_20304_1 [Eumeta japonica]|uniref:Uncharacterized protein n=1 Tax=Eumeta variegata TaxID=151549 RepID=A0A4C1VNA3_EUMVA|nr:hypothetical protein EVAR_20304_1 [Eumeta japonica]
MDSKRVTRARKMNTAEENENAKRLETEHIVDSRPLTEVDIEPKETEGLRPNHFLIGRSCGAAAVGHFDDNVRLGPTNWRTCRLNASLITSGRGLDNQVRVVDVETTGGVLRRPTSKIIVLVSSEVAGGYSLFCCTLRGKMLRATALLTIICK